MPSRLPQIEVVSAWIDPADQITWSGTVANLLAELQALGAGGDYRDATPATKPALAIRWWLGRTRRLSHAWVFAPEMRLLAAACNVPARRPGVSRADGWLLPGGVLGRPVRHPFATWTDMTPAQIAASHPEHSASFGYADVSDRTLTAVLRSQTAVFRQADTCLAVSHWAADSLVRDHGIPASRVKVVGAGRNVTVPTGIDRDWTTPRFLYVGRNWKRKNGDTLVRAFDALRREVPTAELHLVGDHPPLSVDGVVSHGALSFAVEADRPQLEDLFARSTCFVMPSWIEPFGIVYVEAATAGIPSIGTTRGGSATAIGDGGLLVDPADAAGLVAAMRRLADPATAQTLGARAQARCEAFTWRACAERVVRAFDPVAAEREGFADFLPARVGAGTATTV